MAKKITKKLVKTTNARKDIKNITVKNAAGDPDTTAQILIQNKINYTPKVSVIIPVYNVEKYLRQCLDSVVNQTLKEIEIICVDDGSTDSSLEILKEYAARDKRITVVTQKNLHAGIARNAGLAIARGEYLSFLDSDDFFELNMLECAYNKISQDKSDIVIFRYSKYDCNTKEVSRNLGGNEKYLRTDKTIKPLDVRTFDVTSPMPWNKMFNKQFILDKELRFSSTPVCNDLFFVLASISVADSVSYCNQSLLFYRMFQKNSLSASRQKFKFSFLKAFLDLKNFLEKHNVFDVYKQAFYNNLYGSINWTAKQQENEQQFYEMLFEQNDAKLLNIVSMDDLKVKATRPDLFISLTSYPLRIPALHKTIESLLNQTVKADKVILWLAYEQFPNREKDLPKQLLDLIPQGLQIEWCSDLRAYKKLIPALKKYPEALIATADDDIIYPENWLELLLRGYKEFPHMINCHRSYRISVSNGEILPYAGWTKGKRIPRKGAYGQTGEDAKTGFRNFYTSGSGALYPPHSLHPDVFREDLFTTLAPTEDDVWFWSMAVHNNTKIHVVDGNLGLMDMNTDSDQSQALYNTNSQNNTTNNIFQNIFNYFNDIKDRVVNDDELIVISLTSYPARIGTINQTIESLLNQTYPADKVVLWLAPEQFPNREGDLPKQLLDLREHGLIIDWYHDIRSYKKLIPTLKRWPDALIVTADDDNIYSPTWLEKLVKSYKKYPTDIHAHRVTKFYYKDSSFHTVAGGRDYYPESSYLNKLVGLGGVLYPAHCFYKDILDEKLIMKLAPTNDDQWFWLQAAMNGVRVRVVENPEIKAHYVPGTQETALCKINDNGPKLFWKDFNRQLEYYPQLKEILLREFYRHESSNLAFIPYKAELENWYTKRRGAIDLDNPKTFNEKIQWLKLFASTPEKTRLADKYLVRDWVADKIGEEYLIPLLGVYDSFEEIDFKKLPNQFVIKTNHGAGYNIVVKDKSALDLSEVKAKLDKWMSENFAFKYGYELQYCNIVPKIVIEKYIENKSATDLNDYKFYCFDGKVKYVQVISERTSNSHKVSFYDTKWKKQKWWDNIRYDGQVPKPKCFDKMLKLAQKLCRGFAFVRVDLYYLDTDEIYFGEMTFTPGSGMMRWSSERINRYLGSMIKLPKLAYNINTGEYYKVPKKTAYVAKQPRHTKSYLLFPYYVCANLFMRLAQLPMLKFKKHTKNVLYSHSHRGKMDMMNAKFSKIMQSIQSAKNDTLKQINVIKKQLNDVVDVQKKIIDEKYSTLSKQFAEQVTVTSVMAERLSVQISELASRVENVSENLSTQLSDSLSVASTANDKLSKKFNELSNAIGRGVDDTKAEIANNYQKLGTGISNVIDVIARNKADSKQDILSVKQEVEKTNAQIDVAKQSIERDQVLYYNPWSTAVNTERGKCDMVYAPNFEERFKKLMTGLPVESAETVVKIIRRLQMIKGTMSKLDLFTSSEKDQLRKVRELNNEILKVSDGLYAYKNYMLPINHFEPSVFLYKHGVDKLKSIESFKDKDILDIGGFIGDSILVLSPLTSGKIHSFEASETNYNHMLKTIELNGIKNAVPVHAAAGEHPGEIELRFKGSGSSQIETMVKDPKFIEKCPVVKIDNYVREHGLNVGLIKVDIEGAEQEFLRGAKETICTQKPTLLISIYHSVDDFLDIKPMIESWNLGYKFKVFKPTIESVSSETLLICEQ